jgi:uncharacterized protein YcaQ
MSDIVLTPQQARNLHLAAQGLLRAPRARATRRGMLVAIERMQLLQIDTIHVVARSPYLVLFSRLGAYPPRWLDNALASGDIFECWVHEACFAPIADFALHRHGQNPRDSHWAYKHAQRMHRDHRDGMDRLLAHIRANGPVKSSDFSGAQKRQAGWWGWKDEKRWLEAWFALGELMILRRDNFQRVYDLSERVLDRIGLPMPEPFAAADIRKTQMLRALRALGVAQARWLADYFRSGRRFSDEELEPHLASGELIAVGVKGWERPAYVHADHAALLDLAARGRLRATHSALLSPFDPVVWDRARARAMFDFDYTIECYTPQHKRRYGYFVLPILRRGRIVGRLDAKAHRDQGAFEIRKLYFEPGIRVDEKLLADVADAVHACAQWHETPRVELSHCEPGGLRKPMSAALAASRRRAASA